jgi:hypothetical protein
MPGRLGRLCSASRNPKVELYRQRIDINKKTLKPALASKAARDPMHAVPAW